MDSGEYKPQRSPRLPHFCKVSSTTSNFSFLSYFCLIYCSCQNSSTGGSRPLTSSCSGILGQGPGDLGKRKEANTSNPQMRPYCEQATGVVLSVCWWRTGNTKGVSPIPSPHLKQISASQSKPLKSFLKKHLEKNGGKKLPSYLVKNKTQTFLSACLPMSLATV